MVDFLVTVGWGRGESNLDIHWLENTVWIKNVESDMAPSNNIYKVYITRQKVLFLNIEIFYAALF